MRSDPAVAVFVASFVLSGGALSCSWVSRRGTSRLLGAPTSDSYREVRERFNDSIHRRADVASIVLIIVAVVSGLIAFG